MDNSPNGVQHDKAMTRDQLLRRGAGLAAAITIGDALRVAPAIASRVPKPRRGGTLNVASAGGSTNVRNPFNTQNAVDKNRDYLVFERLGEPTYDGSGVKGVLATSARPNSDATIWTVRLRDGVRFHDGSQLDAHDVVYSYKESFKTADIGGIPDTVVKADIKAIDRLTVQFHFQEPNPDGLLDLYYTGNPPILRNGDKNYNHESIGTGPFTLAGINLSQSALLKRNPHYWGSGASDVPYVDSINLLSVADEQARVSALRAGSIDYDAEISYAYAKVNQHSREVALDLSNVTGALNYVFFLNSRIKPLDNPQVRLALKLACNRQQLINSVGYGFGVPGNDTFWEGFAGNAKLAVRPYDPDQARSLLQKAGASGMHLEITSLEDRPATTDAATVWAQQLQAVGVNATVRPRLVADVYGDLKTFDQTMMAYSVPYTSFPWPYAASLFLVPGQARDFTGWASASWASRYKQARQTVNTKKRLSLDAQLQREVWDTGGIIVWGALPSINARSPKVIGVQDKGSWLYTLYPNFTTAWMQR